MPQTIVVTSGADSSDGRALRSISRRCAWSEHILFARSSASSSSSSSSPSRTSLLYQRSRIARSSPQSSVWSSARNASSFAPTPGPSSSCRYGLPRMESCASAS